MFEQYMDSAESASSDASNAAYQSLFADAYNFNRPASGSDRSTAKQVGPGAPADPAAPADKPPPESLPPVAPDASQPPKDETVQDGEYDDFQYEMIYRDVQPGQHTMADGETLESIARQHLGRDASDQDVQNHAQEINRINGGQVSAGQQLVLPGHTADGDVVMPNKDGTNYTISGDPAERYRQAQAFQSQYHKPPDWAGGGQSAEQQGTPGQDPNQGCYRASVEYQYAVRDQQGRIQLRDVNYSYMRCPPDFTRQQ